MDIQDFFDKLCNAEDDSITNNQIMNFISIVSIPEFSNMVKHIANDWDCVAKLENRLQSIYCRPSTKTTIQTKAYQLIMILRSLSSVPQNSDDVQDTSQQSNISDLSNRVQAMRDIVDDNSLQISEISKQYNTLKKQLSLLNKKIGTMEQTEQLFSNSIKAFNDMKSDVETLQQTSGKLSKDLEGAVGHLNNADKKIQQSKDSVIALTVTVLSIFASITLAFSGSLSALNNLFNAANLNIFEAIFKFAMVGLFVADIMFFLIYCIAKLNNKSIAMHCGRNRMINHVCTDCSVYQEHGNSHALDCYSCPHKNFPCN